MTTIDDFAVRPGDPEYDRARSSFSGTATPAVVLRPTSSAEVAAALAHAREERLALAIRSGGHSFPNHGNVDGGVVLDLSRLDAVEHLGEGRVRIGGGATWGAVAAALAEHGLAISSGDVGSVGVGGLTQAGGVGWMVRKHGLTIDSLLGAEVVTAAGEVVRASPSEHPDLFWALRGGAGNFGVVTSFEFQAQPETSVHFGTFTYALEDLRGLLTGWAAAMAAAPDELTTILALMPGFGDAPGTVLLYACLADDDPAALAPLRGLGRVLAEDVAERPYASVLEEGHPPEGVRPVVGNTLVPAVDEALVDAIVTAYDAGGRVVFLRSLGGAFGRVDAGATAFPHRDAVALVVSAAFLPTDATPAQVEAAHAAWRPIGERGTGAYAGFLGSADADDVARLWPEATLARLRAVKRAWDPGNEFRRNLNIEPAGEAAVA